MEITRRLSCWSSSASTRARGPGGVFEIELLDSRPGFLVFRASGSGALGVFCNESGGHRWQQIQAGADRVHTSTVTVAVLREPEETELVLREQDLEYQATKGSGPGGQNRNKVCSAILLKYKPTGLTIRCETERDQYRNKKLALGILRARLLEERQTSIHASRNEDRRTQVGVGARGDKRRTIRTQDDIVTDHVLGKKMRFRDYERGDWSW